MIVEALSLLLTVLTFVVVVVGGVFAVVGIELMTRVIAGWTSTYTMVVAAGERERRRAEIASDVYEQIVSDREHGYANGEIAARMLLRWLIGAPADVTWALPRALARLSVAVPDRRTVMDALLLAPALGMTMMTSVTVLLKGVGFTLPRDLPAVALGIVAGVTFALLVARAILTRNTTGKRRRGRGRGD